MFFNNLQCSPILMYLPSSETVRMPAQLARLMEATWTESIVQHSTQYNTAYSTVQYSTWAESTLWSGSRLEDTRLTRRPPSPAVTRIQEVAPGLESRIS